MDIKPDTIHVNATESVEVQASSADLYIAVKGTSLVSGESALTQAREVKELLDSLGQAGLPTEAVSLQSVDAETSSGKLTPSSSATYKLRLRCENLDQFAGFLGVITSQKNTSIEKIEWQYPEEPLISETLEKAIHKVETRARSIAAALGVSLLGIYEFTEKIEDQDPPSTQVAFGAQSKNRAMGVISQPDLEMEIQHSKEIEVKVFVTYRVSGFEKS